MGQVAALDDGDRFHIAQGVLLVRRLSSVTGRSCN